MRKFQNIYLDLDGVLGDFHSAALAAHGSTWRTNDWPEPGTSWPKELPNGPPGSSEHAAFWSPILAIEDFFLTVKPFPWVHELVELCKSYVGPHSVVVLSGPASGTEREAQQKLRWLGNHGINLELKIEKEKWRYSTPGTLLIDDWEKQVDSFYSKGQGVGILFPQPWSRNHRHSTDPVAYTRWWLDFLTARYAA